MFDQLVPYPGIGLSLRVPSQVRPNRGLERLEIFELAVLAGDFVILCGKLLDFVLELVDPELPGLAPAGFIGMVLGELDLPL